MAKLVIWLNVCNHLSKEHKGRVFTSVEDGAKREEVCLDDVNDEVRSVDSLTTEDILVRKIILGLGSNILS